MDAESASEELPDATPSMPGWLWRALQGAHLGRSRYTLTCWLFSRAFGAVAAIAFASLWVQIVPLVGEQGVLPVRDYTERLARAWGEEPGVGGWRCYLRAPTLSWWWPGDTGLRGLCAVGFGAAVAAMLGVAPAAMALLIYVCYLSLTVAGQEFLTFQWDTLLLEVAILVTLFAPWRLWPRLSDVSSRFATLLFVFLLRWLLFRLELGSGGSKLMGGDPTWRDGTALDFHFFTQPLPTWPAWYAQQLPGWFQRFSVRAMFVIQLGLPILFFAPRALRLVAFGGTVLLQALIALTGNYGFFNLLALALCLALLDDAVLLACVPRRWRERLVVGPGYRMDAMDSMDEVDTVDKVDGGTEAALTRDSAAEAPPEANGWSRRLRLLGDTLERRWKPWIVAPLAAALFALGAVPFAARFAPGVREAEPGWFRVLRRATGGFYLANNYGLFANMTIRRPEVEISWSEDGRTWTPYAFPWKIGRLDRPPGFLPGHLPRLDWRLWFSALELERGAVSPWFERLLAALASGRPGAMALLARTGEATAASNPAPRFLRVELYDYEFTTRAERRATGAWWKRDHRRVLLTVDAARLRRLGR